MIRRLDWIAAALTGVALWSLCGVVLCLDLDAIDIAWKFAWALGGSGGTLVLVGLYQARVRD